MFTETVLSSHSPTVLGRNMHNVPQSRGRKTVLGMRTRIILPRACGRPAPATEAARARALLTAREARLPEMIIPKRDEFTFPKRDRHVRTYAYRENTTRSSCLTLTRSAIRRSYQDLCFQFMFLSIQHVPHILWEPLSRYWVNVWH